MAAQEQEIERLFGNSPKAQAAMLLGRNISESQVADILGVSPALISQYKEDPAFSEQVRLMQLDASLAATLRDEKINELEDSVLDRVKDVLPYITKPMELVGVLRTINSLQRRGATSLAASALNQQNNTVVLELPPNITKGEVNLKFNTSNEVVEVEGRMMHTMPAPSVQKMAELDAQERLESRKDSGLVLEAQAEDSTESEIS